MKADIEKQISIAVGIAKNQKQLFPVKEPVYVDFIWFEDTRKRDVDNIISAKKYILDVLQKSGILPNDNRNWVINVRDTVVDDIENKVLVQLFPVPKEQLKMIEKRKKEIDKEKRKIKNAKSTAVKIKVPKKTKKKVQRTKKEAWNFMKKIIKVSIAILLIIALLSLVGCSDHGIKNMSHYDGGLNQRLTQITD